MQKSNNDILFTDKEVEDYFNRVITDNNFEKYARLYNISSLDLFRKIVNMLMDNTISIDELDSIEMMTDYYLEEFLRGYEYKFTNKGIIGLYGNNYSIIDIINTDIDIKAAIKKGMESDKTRPQPINFFKVNFGAYNGSMYSNLSSLKVHFKRYVIEEYRNNTEGRVSQWNFTDVIYNEEIDKYFNAILERYINKPLFELSNDDTILHFLISTPYKKSYVENNLARINNVFCYTTYSNTFIHAIHTMTNELASIEGEVTREKLLSKLADFLRNSKSLPLVEIIQYCLIFDSVIQHYSTEAEKAYTITHAITELENYIIDLNNRMILLSDLIRENIQTHG